MTIGWMVVGEFPLETAETKAALIVTPWVANDTRITQVLDPSVMVLCHNPSPADAPRSVAKTSSSDNRATSPSAPSFGPPGKTHE